MEGKGGLAVPRCGSKAVRASCRGLLRTSGWEELGWGDCAWCHRLAWQGAAEADSVTGTLAAWQGWEEAGGRQESAGSLNEETEVEEEQYNLIW